FDAVRVTIEVRDFVNLVSEHVLAGLCWGFRGSVNADDFTGFSVVERHMPAVATESAGEWLVHHHEETGDYCSLNGGTPILEDLETCVRGAVVTGGDDAVAGDDFFFWVWCFVHLLCPFHQLYVRGSNASRSQFPRNRRLRVRRLMAMP